MHTDWMCDRICCSLPTIFCLCGPRTLLYFVLVRTCTLYYEHTFFHVLLYLCVYEVSRTRYDVRSRVRSAHFFYLRTHRALNHKRLNTLHTCTLHVHTPNVHAASRHRGILWNHGMRSATSPTIIAHRIAFKQLACSGLELAPWSA